MLTYKGVRRREKLGDIITLIIPYSEESKVHPYKGHTETCKLGKIII